MNSSIVEVGVGLVLVYMVLSLLVKEPQRSTETG